MALSLADLKNLTDVLESLATVFGLAVAGVWAYRRYVLQAERWPHVATSAEVNFVGRQEGRWLVELVAVLDNRGKVEHRVKDFTFDLSGLRREDPLLPDEQWGGQVSFPQSLSTGSFLPQNLKYFSVGPGVTARYSFLASFPDDVSFVLLHCSFRYMDRAGYSHSMECTAKVPDKPA